MLTTSQTKLKLNSIIIAALCAILLSSCVFPYEKGAWWKGGYLSSENADGTVEVSYHSSPLMKINVNKIYVVYRTTELAKERDANVMAILRMSTRSNQSQLSTYCTVRFLKMNEAGLKLVRDRSQGTSMAEDTLAKGNFYSELYAVEDLQNKLEKYIVRGVKDASVQRNGSDEKN